MRTRVKCAWKGDGLYCSMPDFVKNQALSSVVPLTPCFFASSKLAILKSYGSSKSALGSPWKGLKSTINESLTAKTASSSMYLLFRSKICVTIGLYPGAASYFKSQRTDTTAMNLNIPRSGYVPVSLDVYPTPAESSQPAHRTEWGTAPASSSKSHTFRPCPW